VWRRAVEIDWVRVACVDGESDLRVDGDGYSGSEVIGLLN
jgi:hypothetical protein